VCPIRPSILYVEHPKNGTCGVFQHNRHEGEVSRMSASERGRVKTRTDCSVEQLNFLQVLIDREILGTEA
jgi:hypothetical protein